MHQNCNIPQKGLEEFAHLKGTSLWSRIKRTYVGLIMVSNKNPLTCQYFRSETSVREERIRHLSSRHPYIIHPLSLFRIGYDIWIILMYMLMLVQKPIDAATSFADAKPLVGMVTVSLLTDLFSWMIIISTFFMGYIKDKKKEVEMSPKQIARHYVFSIFFIVDVCSSLPRWGLTCLLGDLTHTKFNTVTGCVIILNHLKILRLITVIGYVHKMSLYLRVKSRGKIFWLATFIITSFTIHWAACLQLSIPRLTRDYMANDFDHYQTWLSDSTLQGKSFARKYVHAFFKSSAILLGIRINLYQMFGTEDYVIVIITYIVGKLIICAAWVVIMVSTLNSRNMTIKFHMVMNELEEYMKQKQLPMNLRTKMSMMYKYIFHGKLVRTSDIQNVLSEKLNQDVTVHVRSKLIKNVSLFKDLSSTEIRELVNILIPEIFMPKDIIIRSGETGKSMYFLCTGTVAVYTRSGKEICHLQDGAYFGEIALVFKDSPRSATIEAIEITQVYRLDKKDFRKTLSKNSLVLEKMQSTAIKRLAETREIEEAYKRKLFEDSYRFQADGHFQ